MIDPEQRVLGCRAEKLSHHLASRRKQFRHRFRKRKVVRDYDSAGAVNIFGRFICIASAASLALPSSLRTRTNLAGLQWADVGPISQHRRARESSSHRRAIVPFVICHRFVEQLIDGGTRKCAWHWLARQ